MQKIRRRAAPSFFTTFISRHKPQNWSKDFTECTRNGGNEIYSRAREELIEDQNRLSGYTELQLEEKVRHIDHFLKRSLFPRKTFMWENFIVDNHCNEYGADYKDQKLGAKDQSINQSLINPVSEDPQYFFTYTSNGKIIPKPENPKIDKDRAKRTIEYFNLNHASLLNLRMTIIQYIIESKNGGMSDDDIKQAIPYLPSVVEWTLSR